MVASFVRSWKSNLLLLTRPIGVGEARLPSIGVTRITSKELDRLIHKGLIGRVIHGIWSAEKRGQNYGVMLIREVYG